MEKKMFAVMLNDVDTMGEDYYQLMGLFGTAKEAIEVLHKEHKEGVYDGGYVQKMAVGEMLKDCVDVEYNIIASFDYQGYTEFEEEEDD